ncbi:ATP-binding cassette domain-containing protein [Puia sp.]|uniref:ATP-binding cassette domain-containing protein n=1 Tax=Puia sp. TaxID=2045100 RepID=UPI0032C237E1
MPQNEIAISVKGLKKSYKNIPVLAEVDLEVKTGSIFALLGSNGSGKTTIVKILTTLLEPNRIKISFSSAFAYSTKTSK